MPTTPKSRSIALLVLVTAALLVFPAAAQATLAYVKGTFHPFVYAAADNGEGAHEVGPGRSPRVSPDGQLVAFAHEGQTDELKLASAAGGQAETLMTNLQDSFYLTFSPDSTTIAALRGPELGKRKLVLIDLASGHQRVVARGFFSGFSFSPDSTELVYAKANSERYPPRSDVFRVPVAAGNSVQITHDQRSEDPLWGPTGQIVFVKQLGANKRKYGPKNELFLMNPQGQQVRRLTHTRVDPLLIGLFPTDWSANGNRLLAEFEGQDTSYAVTVNPRTGAQRRVHARPVEKCPPHLACRDGEELDVVGTALSSDGKTVLGFTGGFEPGPFHAVVGVPYPSGKVSLFVPNAFEPDWSL